MQCQKCGRDHERALWVCRGCSRRFECPAQFSTAFGISGHTIYPGGAVAYGCGPIEKEMVNA